MGDNEDNKSRDGDRSSKDGVDKAIEQALHDPAKKARLLQRLGIGGDSDENRDDTSAQGDSRMVTGLGAVIPVCSVLPLVGSL